ncbi:DNA double-strand break repair nuclease NurA [Myxacorys almedinensis]|uniref:DNA double-strand break repair nuclease NurA n=1 Tax=Myxacorys almedinensis A TaxID=2690445 RepID=A0A8J8CIJ4_9CYAN|nr:DNA double-strand break repair nuclease NurA [Myxacorys almedinensis]NDJ16581.1 DNA double-strand break repair nuclease NurA [Myxacorys almedinensis A]
MLDLTKLAQQMQGISQHLTVEATATRQRIERAELLMAQAYERQAELVEMQKLWRDRFIFTAAEPIESLNSRIDIDSAPLAHTVIATDGSQIAPSHHEIAYCYLINIGRIILHYGQSKLPLLDSLPEAFYRSEDLYASRQWGIRTEEWMGYRRTTQEACVLAELAEALGEERERVAPTISLVDGSLLYWFLEPLPAEARDQILSPILEAWDKLRSLDVPLVGYISASRSGEALNFLRLQSCAYLAPDCASHCAGQTGREVSSNRAPCQVLDPLKDTALWGRLLQPGQRSPLWKSSARIQEFYGDHAIHFCYMHVGSEIARIEVPGWVACDREMLDSALSLVLAQVQKGYGYPVALAEAHNQAVVRGGDRARFFALLEQQMIRAGLKNVGTSYKETRKRGSIA